MSVANRQPPTANLSSVKVTRELLACREAGGAIAPVSLPPTVPPSY
jgi:hypothetical protein